MKTKLKIKAVEEFPDAATTPVLANFQNGTLQPGSEKDFKCVRATDTAAHKSNMLLAANNNNLYKGQIGEGSDGGLVNTFIVIRNKASNKVRLVQVQECQLISKDYDPTERPSIHLDIKETYLKKFGGKKGSKYFDKVVKQKMNPDVIKDDIEQSLINIDEKRLFVKELDVLKAQHMADIMPPMVESENVRVAYNLKEILSPEIFSHLEAVAKAILVANTDDLPVKCQYILKRIQNIQLSKEPDSPANIERLKICIYMDALANLLAFGRKTINNKQELSQLSSSVEDHIRNNFKPAKSSFQNSAYTQAKAHCYFLVLAFLLTNDFTLDIGELVRDTSFEKQSVIKYGMYCGARLDSRANTMILKTGKKRELYVAPSMKKGRK